VESSATAARRCVRWLGSWSHMDGAAASSRRCSIADLAEYSNRGKDTRGKDTGGRTRVASPSSNRGTLRLSVGLCGRGADRGAGRGACRGADADSRSREEASPVGVWGNMRGNVQCPADAAGGSCPEWPPGNNMRRISNRGLQPRLVSQGDRWPPATRPNPSGPQSLWPPIPLAPNPRKEYD